MKSFIFTSGNTLNSDTLNSLVTFADEFPKFFEVVLANDSELKILFSLLGLSNISETLLSESEDFEKLFDISESLLPELSTEQFDKFYETWLKETGRESDMDEYGQLIFIQGQAVNWNNNSKRIVLSAKP